ncbi:DUF4189 domain-containing protein [Massilia sp. G4R7]|uniref:DUF4189 domain-containing protein n=1 Tax=Massilia phyllostachyos TaxID=2898585 RepID=A0ABS8Q885_9BURK|nr:DUF4189 domain-containing protein [Massilia phyllostachyos]MCD2517967.1 DUF4189 domain-containing protein [Massilia phyllostachyos]
MNFHRTILISLIGLALTGASHDALAAAAVAAGSNGYSYTLTEATDLEKAKAEALAECQRRAPDCEIVGWTTEASAIALAKSADGSIVTTIRPTPELARDAAMKRCRAKYKGCKFAAVYWEPGGDWVAWATAKGPDGLLVAQHYAYRYTTESEASRTAMKGCTEKLKNTSGVHCTVASGWGAFVRAIASSSSYTSYRIETDRATAEAGALKQCREESAPGDACKIDSVAENTAPRAKPASFDKVFAQTTVARENATLRPSARPNPPVPPRGQALSCTNRCVNGSCVRTFANGRTERWQAPRVLDPFTNNWKWDTSSCGG